MTALVEVIGTLSSHNPEATIYASKPWTTASVAAVLFEGEDDVPTGLSYMLEVNLAVEAVKAWSQWRDGRQPTTDEALAAVIYYAEHDAYEPLE